MPTRGEGDIIKKLIIFAREIVAIEPTLEMAVREVHAVASVTKPVTYTVIKYLL